MSCDQDYDVMWPGTMMSWVLWIGQLVLVVCLYREALMLVDELKLCLTEVEQEAVVPVELLDPNVAGMYSKSRRARVCRWRVVEF